MRLVPQSPYSYSYSTVNMDSIDKKFGTNKKAAALLVWWDGKVMLTQRRKTPYFSGYWAAVGGSVEPNEFVEEAIRREMMEETGVFIPNYDIHLIDCYQEDDFKCFFFEAQMPPYRFKDIKNTEPKKHSPWQLFTIEEALKLPKLMPAIRELLLIKKAQKKKRA